MSARRRGLMGVAEEEPAGILMFQPSFHTSTSTGTITNDGNTVTMTSTGTASWTLNVTPVDNYSTIKNLLNHKIKVVLDLSWVNKPSGASWGLGFGGFDQTHLTRKAYASLPTTPGHHEYEYVVTRSLFSADASKYNENDYFAWKAYLNSSSGGKVVFDVKFYDMGVSV